MIQALAFFLCFSAIAVAPTKVLFVSSHDFTTESMFATAPRAQARESSFLSQAPAQVLSLKLIKGETSEDCCFGLLGWRIQHPSGRSTCSSTNTRTCEELPSGVALTAWTTRILREPQNQAGFYFQPRHALHPAFVGLSRDRLPTARVMNSIFKRLPAGIK